MKQNIKILGIVIVLIFLGLLLSSKENFAATSPGTLTQLVAKGPQDSYLTSFDPYRYPYYYGSRRRYPYYGYYPYGHHYRHDSRHHYRHDSGHHSEHNYKHYGN